MSARRSGRPSLINRPSTPCPVGSSPIECSILVGDPFGDELLDATVGSEDADRAVSSVRQIDGELHDASQDGLQRSLGGERQPSLDEELGTISALDPVRHVRSLAFVPAYRRAPLLPGRWPARRGSFGPPEPDVTAADSYVIENERSRRCPMRVMVACASKHGSTEGIAEAIAERLRQLGNDATAVRVGDVDNLDGVDAAVLGSAVYAGSWMKDAVEFAEANAERLAGMPVWLFSSGPLGTEVHDDEEQPRQLARALEDVAARGPPSVLRGVGYRQARVRRADDGEGRECARRGISAIGVRSAHGATRSPETCPGAERAEGPFQRGPFASWADAPELRDWS